MSDSIAAWLAEHNIREVRVEGTNLEGSFIGKFVSPGKFLSGLTSGFAFADVAFGLDMSNNPQFGFAMPDWRGDMLDIFLHVDTDTLIEWSPGRASVIGDFRKPDGESISACPRAALRRMVQDLSGLGYEVRTAVEIEATVFEESIHEARAKRYRDLTPLGGTAGSCYHLAKSADWSEYMRAVVDRLDEVGIPWEAYNDEAAAGQIEFNITPSDPVSTADYWARTRQIMRETAFALGRTVTFMAKFSNEYGQASHLNVSLERDGRNAFYAESGPSAVMDEFIGGVMATLIPATSFALPMITSYRRLVDLDGPPTTATWGIANKTAAVRAVVGHETQSRIEYRTPGADSNVYLVLSVILAGGIAGIKNNISAPEPFREMAWCLPDGVERLPDTLSKAVAVLKEDALLAEVLGQDLIDYWIGTREWEWLQFHTGGGEPDVGVTQWESDRYFELP